VLCAVVCADIDMSMLDRFRLDGKVVLVTGGAGLYGRQIVLALAEAGALVVTASRDVAKLEVYASELRARELDVTADSLDQGDEPSILRLRDELIAKHGRIDVLVNNAVLRTMRDWSDPAENFARSMEVNATGLFLITRAMGDQMAKQAGGSIVNVGSIQGSVGPDFTLYEGLGMGAPPDYFFHKGGMIQLTRYAASVLGKHGVRVNCVSPGGFYDGQDARFVERYAARTLLGRMAGENDLGGAIVFLASDASAYITGANIPVDGGYTAK
jgi:NAD(P)-dependent dehydrogenase (short-subunit alcohol dehydrogenase family)